MRKFLIRLGIACSIGILSFAILFVALNNNTPQKKTEDEESGASTSNVPQKEAENEESIRLTMAEATRLREFIHDNSPTIRTMFGAGASLPYHEVALPDDVILLHRKKRIDTIKFLLKIVKVGNASDARFAGVTARALEDGPEVAVSAARWNLDLFDRSEAGEGQTYRESLVESLEKRLADAAKLRDCETKRDPQGLRERHEKPRLFKD